VICRESIIAQSDARHVLSERTKEAARSHPESERQVAQPIGWLLQWLPPDSDALQGVLVIDDTTLDKPYASQMALVSRHWSGKYHEVAQGINRMRLVWSAGVLVSPFSTVNLTSFVLPFGITWLSPPIA
jgi:hypothetical protein